MTPERPQHDHRTTSELSQNKPRKNLRTTPERPQNDSIITPERPQADPRTTSGRPQNNCQRKTKLFSRSKITVSRSQKWDRKMYAFLTPYEGPPLLPLEWTQVFFVSVSRPHTMVPISGQEMLCCDPFLALNAALPLQTQLWCPLRPQLVDSRRSFFFLVNSWIRFWGRNLDPFSGPPIKNIEGSTQKRGPISGTRICRFFGQPF